MFAQNRDHAPLNVVFFFTDDNEEGEGRKPLFLTMTERSA